jgi:hypothetical protein
MHPRVSILPPEDSSLLPNDLPFNIPDAERYPYARYGGLKEFIPLLSYEVAWNFIVDLGGKRDVTPGASFWTQSFNTQVMLKAYFKLQGPQRLYFMQHVVWIRDPLPGRPGGVQIAPPEWPSNLPTPIHHGMTRYAGLDRWVATLGNDWAEVARLALFGIHEKFDPIWWLDYHKTVDMFNLYTRLSPSLREDFVESVYWIPDGGRDASARTADRGGKDTRNNIVDGSPDFSPRCDTPDYSVVSGNTGDSLCYLTLFRGEHHMDILKRLGENPWAGAVSAALLDSVGLRSSGLYKLTLGPRVKNKGTAFVQAHVESSSDGLTITELLPYLAGAMRVGAIVPSETSDMDARTGGVLTDNNVGVGTHNVFADSGTLKPCTHATPSLGPDVNGYCYLALFKEEHRDKVLSRLKDNPWAVAVALTLLSEPDMRSTGNFRLTIGNRVTNGETSFIQGHIEADSNGAPLEYLIFHFVGSMRLGATADINALLNSQAQDPVTSQPTVYPSIPVRGGAGIELTFNVYGRMGKDQVKYPNVTFNVMSEPTFMILLGTFESVQLEAAMFNIQVSTGAANSLACAISGPENDLSTDISWLATPINTFVYGSDAGFVNGTFVLPDVHPFERELRYPNNTGNPIPVFRFGFTGVAGGFATIKGQIRVRVRGQFALGHLRIGGPSAKVTRDNHSLVANSLPVYNTCRTLRDGDEPDSEANTGATSTSPGKSNTSATRQ